jgi:hypothetical protein
METSSPKIIVIVGGVAGGAQRGGTRATALRGL